MGGGSRDSVSVHQLLSMMQSSQGLIVAGAAVLSALVTSAILFSTMRCPYSSDVINTIEKIPCMETGPDGANTSRFQIPTYAMAGPIPWPSVGPIAQSEFTLGGRIPVKEWFQSKKNELERPVWTKEAVDSMVAVADKRDPETDALSWYTHDSNRAFFDAFKAYPIVGKSVLVVGSESPWVEAICLSFKGGKVTTVDFNPPICDHPDLRMMSIPELDASKETFDVLISYSSIEHDGLGRYGDPINPWGDLQRMKKLQGLLSPGGLMYLGVPNGVDALEFNSHRIYGPIRFPLLIEGWNLEATFGATLEECFAQTGFMMQPIHVLSVKKT